MTRAAWSLSRCFRLLSSDSFRTYLAVSVDFAAIDAELMDENWQIWYDKKRWKKTRKKVVLARRGASMGNYFRRLSVYLLAMAAMNLIILHDSWPEWLMVTGILALAAFLAQAACTVLTKRLGNTMNAVWKELILWGTVALLLAIVAWLGTESGLLSSAWLKAPKNALLLGAIMVCFSLFETGWRIVLKQFQ